MVIYFIIWRCSTTDVHRTHCIFTIPFLRNISCHNNGVYAGKSRMSSSRTVAQLQRECKLEQRAYLDYDTTVMGPLFQKPFLWKEAKYYPYLKMFRNERVLYSTSRLIYFYLYWYWLKWLLRVYRVFLNSCLQVMISINVLDTTVESIVDVVKSQTLEKSNHFSSVTEYWIIFLDRASMGRAEGT